MRSPGTALQVMEVLEKAAQGHRLPTRDQPEKHILKLHVHMNLGSLRPALSVQMKTVSLWLRGFTQPSSRRGWLKENTNVKGSKEREKGVERKTRRMVGINNNQVCYIVNDLLSKITEIKCEMFSLKRNVDRTLFMQLYLLFSTLISISCLKGTFVIVFIVFRTGLGTCFFPFACWISLLLTQRNCRLVGIKARPLANCMKLWPNMYHNTKRNT